MSHVLKTDSGFCILLGALLLLGCDHRPAATRHPASPPPPAAAAATRIAILPAQDTPATDAATGDIPALHEPVVVTKTVAPGLQLIISSVPVADTAVVREPSDLQLVLTIRKNQRVIFRDTVADGLTYTKYSEPQTSRLYPIWVPTGPEAGQLLVAYNNRPSKDRARRFHIRGNQVVSLDTLPTFDGPARDLDHDGRLEYGGRNDYGEGLSDAQGRALSFYNPVRYYELRPTGLVFDSVLTRRRATAQYGSFHGYQYSERFSFPAKQP